MRRLSLILVALLLLFAPNLSAPPVLAQCGTPEPTWTPTPTYQSIVLGTQSANLIAYFPLNETSGTVADDLSGVSADGTYSGVTLNGTTFLNGDPAPSFDGVNDYVNIYSSALNTNFDGQSGTILLWAKVDSSAVWTDGIVRRMINIYVDGNNSIVISRDSVNNQVGVSYRAGAVSKIRNLTGLGTTSFFQLVLTWDLVAGEAKAYLNGTQQGATLTGIGTWSGNLNSNRTVIGVYDSSTQTNPWLGSIAHVAIWDTALSSTDITALYNVPSAPSPTPTIQPTCAGATDTPTPTNTADLVQFWTMVPPETTGTPEPGQPVAFAYTVNAGQIAIAVFLAAILFTLMAVSLIYFYRRRK